MAAVDRDQPWFAPWCASLRASGSSLTRSGGPAEPRAPPIPADFAWLVIALHRPRVERRAPRLCACQALDHAAGVRWHGPGPRALRPRWSIDAAGTATMFHRGRCIRGRDRGSGVRGGRAGLTGHAGKRWRRPDGGAGRIWPEARPGTSGPAWNQLCDSPYCGRALACHSSRVMTCRAPAAGMAATSAGCPARSRSPTGLDFSAPPGCSTPPAPRASAGTRPFGLEVLHPLVSSLYTQFSALALELDERLDERLDAPEQRVLHEADDEELAEITVIRRRAAVIGRILTPGRDLAARSRSSSPCLAPPAKPSCTPKTSTTSRSKSWPTSPRSRSGVPPCWSCTPRSQAKHLAVLSRRLADVATIFLPISFLAGFWGQNFDVLTGSIERHPTPVLDDWRLPACG